MWLFEGGPQSPGEIRALVLELLGPEGSAAFWQKYRENYVTHEDIALLHQAGLSSLVNRSCSIFNNRTTPAKLFIEFPVARDSISLSQLSRRAARLHKRVIPSRRHQKLTAE